MDYTACLKALREKLLISQTEMAEMLEVSFATVNRLENGHHEPSLKTKRKIRDLCKKYKVKMEEDR
ncbi:MAG: helix-turn-helix transcriptional regulator [Candidatus Enterosoma sp.]|nr:helix-turn-helix transcriptional regulator [Candidatus Enterosoma sp.]